MRSVHVVTHPEAQHHVDGLVGGWYDSALTARGLGAAADIGTELRRRLPTGVPVQVWSSDLRRTRETADVVGAALGGVQVHLDERLREKSYGVAEGRAQSWLDARFLHPPADGDRLDHHEGVPGAETRRQLATRVHAAVEALLASPVEHHVVVTHGFAAVFVIGAWIGLPVAASGQVAFRLSPGSITELREDDLFHNRTLVSLGEVAHLGGTTA